MSLDQNRICNKSCVDIFFTESTPGGQEQEKEKSSKTGVKLTDIINYTNSMVYNVPYNIIIYQLKQGENTAL